VEPRDLPPKFGGAAPAPPPGDQTLAAAIEALEGRMIREVLAACDGNISEAARRLGLRANTLHYKMKRYGVHAR